MTLVVGVDVTVVDRIAGALRRNPRFAQRSGLAAAYRCSPSV
jgi:phosphopantetheinyl transferase (holo-ACP synthase)